MKIISTYWFPSGMYLHNWLIHVHAICSSTYMYMKNVNDVTGWLSQTTDISKYFVWSPGPWDKESRLYLRMYMTTCLILACKKEAIYLWQSSILTFYRNKFQRKLLDRKRVRLACKRPRVRSPRPAHSFVEILSWKHFYGHSPASADLRRAVVNYWRKNVH